MSDVVERTEIEYFVRVLGVVPLNSEDRLALVCERDSRTRVAGEEDARHSECSRVSTGCCEETVFAGPEGADHVRRVVRDHDHRPTGRTLGGPQEHLPRDHSDVVQSYLNSLIGLS